MKRARFVAAARYEFLAEIVYYNKVQPGLGASFTKAVEDAVARVLAFPLAGSLSVANSRRVLIKGFPFALFYRTESHGVVIFAVAHQARRPNYWGTRIDG